MDLEINELFRTSEEYKKIMELVNKLTPWDRRSLAIMLVDEYIGDTEIRDWYGFEDSNETYDSVAEVFNECRENEVLDEMEPQQILDHFVNNYLLTYSDIIEPNQLADIIDWTDSGAIKKMLTDMKEKRPVTFDLIKKIMHKIEYD